MGGNKSHNGPIMALGGINRHDEPNKINDVYFFPILLFFVCSFFFILDIHIVFFSSCRIIVYKKKISGKRTLPFFSFNCWFSVSHHSKEIKIKIKTLQ